MPLAPPPDGAVFPTYDECIRAVQSHAASEGYAVNSKGQAKSKDTGLYRRYVIRCDKSGTFKSNAQLGLRRSSTKKTGCPFTAACNIRPDGCFLKVMVPEHNHPPSTLPGAHIAHRKITDEQRSLIEARAVERKSIKAIWQELKDNDPNIYLTIKDVDNAVQRFRKKAKEGATGVQAIMYKLVARQDLHCFTLERDGVLQGAFWVPHWSTDLWMRPLGTPDILVMLSEHIANRPVLPILEMNSVLNSANFGSPMPTRAIPEDPANFGNPNPNASTIAPDSLAGDSNGGSASPAPSAQNPTSNAPGAHNDIGRGNNGLDASLGAGYAILPDKSDATILWLRSAVELLRQRIPQCPKPRFITLTDFQTAEKNILLEVSKGGVAHRQMHIVFGRVLAEDEETQVHHGVRTRKPRVEGRGRRAREAAAAQAEGGGEGSGTHQEEDDGHGNEEHEEEEEDEDQDMDGDHDSDAEIARQLINASVQNNDHERQSNHMQNVGLGYNHAPQQQNLEQMSGRLPLPGHAPRHSAMQVQSQAQMAYNGMMGTRMSMSGHQSRHM